MVPGHPHQPVHQNYGTVRWLAVVPTVNWHVSPHRLVPYSRHEDKSCFRHWDTLYYLDINYH